LAERERFELSRPFGLPLFESGTFNHSDTSPPLNQIAFNDPEREVQQLLPLKYLEKQCRHLSTLNKVPYHDPEKRGAVIISLNDFRKMMADTSLP
jgi:hypothetical protein